MPDPILVTERLSLREITWDDLDFLATLLGNPEVMRYYPKLHTREESALWLQRVLDRYAKDGHAFWLTTERESGEPVGQVGLLNQEIDGMVEPEIGYQIHAPYWRRGYAAEAAAAVRDYAFTVLDKPRVISLIRPINIPSQRGGACDWLQAGETGDVSSTRAYYVFAAEGCCKKLSRKRRKSRQLEKLRGSGYK